MSADVTALIASLRSADPAEQQAAAEQLAQMETEAQPAAVALVEACGANGDGASEWVVSALESLGPPQTSDIPKLSALLKSSAPDVAYWASTLLGRLEDQAAPAVPALIEALAGHGELAVRQRAAWALGQIGSGAHAALEPLQAAAGDADPRLSKLASEAITQIKG